MCSRSVHQQQRKTDWRVAGKRGHDTGAARYGTSAGRGGLSVSGRGIASAENRGSFAHVTRPRPFPIVRDGAAASYLSVCNTPRSGEGRLLVRTCPSRGHEGRGVVRFFPTLAWRRSQPNCLLYRTHWDRPLTASAFLRASRILPFLQPPASRHWSVDPPIAGVDQGPRAWSVECLYTINWVSPAMPTLPHWRGRGGRRLSHRALGRRASGFWLAIRDPAATVTGHRSSPRKSG